MGLDLGVWLGIISVLLGVIGLFSYKVFKSSKLDKSIRGNKVNGNINKIEGNEFHDSDVVLRDKNVNNHYRSEKRRKS